MLAFIVQFDIACMLMNSYKNNWIIAASHVECCVWLTATRRSMDKCLEGLRRLRFKHITNLLFRQQ